MRIPTTAPGHSLQRREERLAWALLAAPFLVTVGLVLYPVLYNIWISLHHVTLDSLDRAWPWAGPANFIRVFRDWRFLPAVETTIIYSVAASLVSILLGLAAALLLNRPFRGRGVIRGLFLFSFVAPVISVAFIWRWLLEPDGLLNACLLGLGWIERPIAFLDSRGSALVCVICFEGWRYFPFAMLLILARLQAIPDELYEAADLDGAGAWSTFRHITLPELRYILGVLFLLRLLWTFNKFDDIYLLTGGAAGTRVLPILIYDYSFGSLDLGAGAAIAMVLFAVLVLLVSVYVRRVIEW